MSSICEPAALDASRAVPLPADVARAAGEAPITRRRALHVINGEHYSGAERVQDLLALNLPTYGFEPGFACLKPGRFPAMRQSQVPVYELPMRTRFDLRPAFRLARIVRDEHYELIHTHGSRAALVGRLAARMAKVPLVHHVHSPTAGDSTHRWRDRANAWLERVTLRDAEAVITVSHSLADYAVNHGLRGEYLTVVPNGVPTAGPLVNRPCPAGHWTLGTVALFRPRKGFDVLLEALAILRGQKFDVSLRAVGPFETPEYEREIKQLIERLRLDDAIHWVGFTQDVTAELRQMDLFVLPSLFGEGLPMVLLEAMAAGVPVVATKVEGVPEAVRDRIDGVIVAPGDAQALAAGIARVIHGEIDWRLLRTSAHDRQASRFSDRSMAAGVAQVYRELLGD